MPVCTRVALMGVTRYEFLMQARRWVMWLPILASAALMLTFVSGERVNYYSAFTPAETVGTFALLFNFLTPLACGLVVADRLARDRRLHVDDLLQSLPNSARPRIYGKALGAGVATILPWFLIEMLGFSLLASAKQNSGVFLLGMGAFLTINLPAFVFTLAISLVVPLLLWLPLYQVAFVAFWFWVGLDPSRIVSISSSVLSPTGGYAAAGLFNGQGGYAGLAYALLRLGPLAPPPSLGSGTVSIFIILVIAVGVLEVGVSLLRAGQRWAS